MVDEKGMSLTGVLVLLIILLVIISVTTIIFNHSIQNGAKEEIKSNMLLIQGKCNVTKEKVDIVTTQEASKTTGEKVEIQQTEAIMYGRKVSDIKDNDPIVSEFLTKGILTEKEYETFYVLYDADLEALSLTFKNEEGALYIVNYETGEVIYTAGIDEKYKISDMVG